MNNTLAKFTKDESGAVTVDWVVLTAAVVGLGLIVMSAIKEPVRELAADIATEINNASPVADAPPPPGDDE